MHVKMRCDAVHIRPLRDRTFPPGLGILLSISLHPGDAVL